MLFAKLLLKLLGRARYDRVADIREELLERRFLQALMHRADDPCSDGIRKGSGRNEPRPHSRSQHEGIEAGFRKCRHIAEQAGVTLSHGCGYSPLALRAVR